jgi:Helix-turn-helix domain
MLLKPFILSRCCVNWLSPKSIAKKLDMSTKTVHRLCQRGELPCATFPSGRKRVSEEALERFMRNLEKKSRRPQAAHGDDGRTNGDSAGRLPAVQSGDELRKSV